MEWQEHKSNKGTGVLDKSITCVCIDRNSSSSSTSDSGKPETRITMKAICSDSRIDDFESSMLLHPL
jgi:hypothetical protein